MKRRMLIILIFLTSLVSQALGTKPFITGAFWQLHAGFLDEEESFWEEQIEFMEKAGIKTIIIQSTADDTSKLYASSKLIKVRFPGPLKRGSHELMITTLPVTVTEIATPIPFTYQVISPEPAPLLTDDSTKLKDGDFGSIFSAVGWTKEAKGPIKIQIDLATEADYIEVYFMVTGTIPELDTITLDQKIGQLFLVNDILTTLLTNAKKHQIDVWLGLKFSDTWWGNDFKAEKEIADNLLTVKALEKYYGQFDNLKGYYLPHEFRPDWRAKENTVFFKKLCEELRQFNRPLAIAPFFRVEMPLKKHQSFWEEFLSEVDFDILMLQDGIGSDYSRLEKILPHYQMVYSLCQKKGIDFWSDVEVFHTDSPNGVGYPASFTKVKQQLEKQAPFCDRLVIFDWLHYMSPLSNSKAKDLYSDYLTYLGNID